MDIHKTIIATLVGIAAVPAFLGIVSFITWRNEFRKMDWWFMARLILVIVAALWILTALPGPA